MRALNSIYEMCQLPIDPRKKSRMSGEGKETLSCRTAALIVAEQTEGSVRAGDHWITVGRGECSAQSKYGEKLR